MKDLFEKFLFCFESIAKIKKSQTASNRGKTITYVCSNKEKIFIFSGGLELFFAFNKPVSFVDTLNHRIGGENTSDAIKSLRETRDVFACLNKFAETEASKYFQRTSDKHYISLSALNKTQATPRDLNLVLGNSEVIFTEKWTIGQNRSGNKNKEKIFQLTENTFDLPAIDGKNYTITAFDTHRYQKSIPIELVEEIYLGFRTEKCEFIPFWEGTLPLGITFLLTPDHWEIRKKKFNIYELEKELENKFPVPESKLPKLAENYFLLKKKTIKNSSFRRNHIEITTDTGEVFVVLKGVSGKRINLSKIKIAKKKILTNLASASCSCGKSYAALGRVGRKEDNLCGNCLRGGDRLEKVPLEEAINVFNTENIESYLCEKVKLNLKYLGITEGNIGKTTREKGKIILKPCLRFRDGYERVFSISFFVEDKKIKFSILFSDKKKVLTLVGLLDNILKTKICPECFSDKKAFLYKCDCEEEPRIEGGYELNDAFWLGSKKLEITQRKVKFNRFSLSFV